jgi:hypothetical protein
MVSDSVGHCVRVLENVPDRDHISQGVLELALSLVNFAVGPPILSLPCVPHGNNWDFKWIREDVCLRTATHLDDDDNLHASIGDLVHHINTDQDKCQWAPFMALLVLYSTVPSFDLTKTSEVHHSPIRLHYNSCPRSMRERFPRLV